MGGAVPAVQPYGPPQGMRRIFIGDIQGCREELEELLEKVRFDPAGDELHPVGDLVNRGPDSLGTLRLLRSLGAGGVLGNHDLHLLAVAAGERAPRPGDSLEALLEADDTAPLLEWLASRPFVRRWPDLYLVHAALHPRWSRPHELLGDEDPRKPGAAALFATRTRYCDSAGTLPPRDDSDPGPPFEPWHHFYEKEEHGGRRVVFGHWAAQGLYVAEHVLGLDSGCVWGNELTAWIAEDERLVSVAARRAHASIRH